MIEETILLFFGGFAVLVGLTVTPFIVSSVLKYREKKLKLIADQTAEKAAQYAAQVERLEARMRVLERIATDKGVQLADEIEDLRDQRPN
jgi:hypothetical protein